MTATLFYETVQSPIGAATLFGREDALVSVDLADDEAESLARAAERFPDAAFEPRPGFGGFAERMRRYFDGDLRALDDLPAQPSGTAFQQSVWDALRSIPPGKTESYGGLAARLGKPSASRAVGLANAKNPVAIVVPCHRVIGSDGKLTGYAGGLDRKLWLLRHEGALI